MPPQKRDFQQNTKMPPKHKSNQEDRILQAIKAIHSNISPNIRAAARASDIPRSTLTNRLRGQSKHQRSQIVNRKLLITQEEALLQWILSMGEQEFLPRISSSRKMADNPFSAYTTSSVDTSLIIGKN